MNYYVYIILCSNGKYYVGHSHNVEKRFDRYADKLGATFTAQNKPVKILWKQEFISELEAVKREKQIKGWSRTKKEKLISGIWS